MKVLLGQLGSMGDCLYATILARQIKEDYPRCHLTWAVSSLAKQILQGNPHVDDIWEWNTPNWSIQDAAWQALETAVLRIQAGPDPFDKVVLSQISPNNFRNFDGTVRPSILRAYDRPITVPIDSVIALSDRELDSVEQFVRANNVDRFGQCILFECSSKSGQSYVTPEFVLEVIQLLNKQLRDCCFILSSHQQIKSDLRNVFSAHDLGLRENAALTHHCTHFVGCGSGLTVVATSEAAKQTPNIQVLLGRSSVYASFFHDFEYWGKPTGRFIEMGDAPATKVADAILMCCRNGLEFAREAFHRPLAVHFDHYLELIDRTLVYRCKYVDALESLIITAQRYGWNEQLVSFGRKKILPLIQFDVLAMDPRTREHSEKLIDLLLKS